MCVCVFYTESCGKAVDDSTVFLLLLPTCIARNGDRTLQIALVCAARLCNRHTPWLFILHGAPTVVLSFPRPIVTLVWRFLDPACPPALSRHISRRTVWPSTWCVFARVCVCDCDPVNSSKRDSRAIDEVDSIAQPCVPAEEHASRGDHVAPPSSRSNRQKTD